MPHYPLPTHSRLARARRRFFDEHLWPVLGYSNYGQMGPHILFLYACWGTPFSENARDYLRAMRNADGGGVPLQKQQTWASIQEVVEGCLEARGKHLVPWILDSDDWFEQWTTLNAVHGIGPKIASWLMRDLSYLRDFHPEVGASRVKHGERRNSKWFQKLSHEDQALFVPVDRHVFRAARQHGALGNEWPDDFSSAQRSPTAHRRAATEIVAWSRARDFDSRDVDMYWYGMGSGWFQGTGDE